MKASILFLIASCFVVLTVAVSPIYRALAPKKADNRENHVRKTPEELSYIFNSSIIYWDLDESAYIPESEKIGMKRQIMKELVYMAPEPRNCECPRNSGTMVCDSTRKLYDSICRFHCKFAIVENGDIKPMPIMILTETPPNESTKVCKQRLANRTNG